MKSHASTAARWGLASFLATAAVFAGIQAGAQAIAGHNSNAPVNYAADRIELQDKQNRVVLSGGVDITQAGLRLQARKIRIRVIRALDAGGGLRVVEVRRHSHDTLVLREREVLRMRAHPEDAAESHDLLTDGERPDIRTDGFDPAGKDRSRRRLTGRQEAGEEAHEERAAGEYVHVGPVGGARADADEELVAAGHRCRDLLYA